MVLEQKYIKDSGYEMEDEFMDALHILNPIVSYKIGINKTRPPLLAKIAFDFEPKLQPSLDKRMEFTQIYSI